MNVSELLRQDATRIIEESRQTVLRSRLCHYAAEGSDALSRHVTELYDCLVACVEANEATPMIEHARRIAGQRFATGFDLQEVQTAINVIEEAVWRHLIAELPPEEFARAIGVVSSILGMGKDALARSYVALAAHSHAPALDTAALFRGTEGL